MKKVLLFVLMLCLLSVPAFAQTGERTEIPADDGRVVGDDIDIGEGEFKIISIDLDEPVDDTQRKAPDEPADDGRVVGDDIEIGEGEAKIISIDLEGGDAVVGDGIEIGEDEAKIVSVDDETKEFPVVPVAVGTGALLLIAVVFIKAKLSGR